MRLTQILASIVLTGTLSLAGTVAAHAEPYCPGYQRVYTIAPPPLVGVDVTADQDLTLRPADEQMYPCDTFSVEGSATNAHMTQDAIFTLNLRSHSDNLISQSITGPATTNALTIPAQSTVTFRVPAAGVILGSPYLNIDVVKVIRAQAKLAYAGVSYGLKVTITSRPGYNRGGSTLSAALPISVSPTTVYGTMPAYGRHQWFKVSLQPKGTVSLSGTLTNIHPTTDANYGTVFYNSAGQQLGASSSLWVPENGQASFQNHNYTNNSGQSLDVYIQARNVFWGFIEPFVITIQTTGLPTPILTLYLDADSNFNLSNPQSDHPNYVPGARLSDGVSVNLPQPLQLIAAYVDGAGKIIPAPSGVTSVTFSLNNTSAFTGIAMNSEAGTETDFALLATSVTFGADNTARVGLNCLDYGGFTTATVMDSSTTTPPMRIPKDDDLNQLPDAGWATPAGHVDSAGLAPDADNETDPAGNVHPGDGLVVFEEYRGFFLGGQHFRTDLASKDLFVNSQLAQGIGYTSSLLISVWNIMSTELDAADRRINFNYMNGQNSILGHYDQKGLVIVDALWNELGQFGLTGWQPPIATPSSNVFVQIYTQVIKYYSPDHNEMPPTQQDDPFDLAKIDQTIAHEIGHAVNLPHLDVPDNNIPCPPPSASWTVMLTRYNPLTTDINNCAWNNIPNVYRDAERVEFRLR